VNSVQPWRALRRRPVLLVSFLISVPIACAPRAMDVPDATAPGVAANAGAGTSTAPIPTAPTVDAIIASEQARVGALRFLHARGVAELRWTDEQGSHFEQGDADIRWCAGRGVAASISKFGDRHAWLGSDGTRWWRFELKTAPSRLVWGMIAASAPTQAAREAQVANPRFLGIAPLLPRAGAVVEVRDGLAWVELEHAGVEAIAGVRVEAGFVIGTLEPRSVRAHWNAGDSSRVDFGELMLVETPGVAQGAWPRIPRRLVAVREGGVTALSIAIDSARADAEAADRPTLYDMDGLRARFTPEMMEEAQ
jgi:hypothetical protein